MKSYDLIVLGGGPAGYVGAIRASQLSMSALVVEKENMGGVCLNWGCIPTKSLLHSGHIFHEVKNAANDGIIDISKSQLSKILKPNFNKIVQRSKKASLTLKNGVESLMKANKIDVANGSGVLLGDGKVQVGKETYKGKNILICTGAKAKKLPTLEGNKNIWYYRDALFPKACPKSLLVVGSGAIGMEFACFYNSIGTKVTIIEMQGQIATSEDTDISLSIRKSLEDQGIEILCDTVIETTKGSSVTLKNLSTNKTKNAKFDKILCAIGIDANTADIGIENTKIQLGKNKHIITDKLGRTHEPFVYAAGDVSGPPWLAHKASHEAVMCVDNMNSSSGGSSSIDPDYVPRCTYTYPQIASIGLTENEVKESGHDFRIGKFPFQINGKSVAIGNTEGFVKVIFNKDNGEVLGCHMIGPEVTEMIHSFALARNAEAIDETLMHTIFPHPTLSEVIHESILDSHGIALHKANAKR